MVRFVQIFGTIGFFVCLIIMYTSPYGVRGIREYDPSFQMPDMKFHYSVRQIEQVFEHIGKGGRGLYSRYLLLDTGFVFCFGILMLTVTDLLFSGKACSILAVVCILRGVFDIFENGILIMSLNHYPDIVRPLVEICSYFTTFKFIMLYIWLAAVIFQLLRM